MAMEEKVKVFGDSESSSGSSSSEVALEADPAALGKPAGFMAGLFGQGEKSGAAGKLPPVDLTKRGALHGVR